MLLSLALGRRRLYGEETETGGIIGRALGDAFRSRLGTTGAVLLATTLVILAVPLATQVSLQDVFLRLRVRFAGLLGRLTVGWARHRDRRTKERLRRTVVAKHLEKARGPEISLDAIPFAEDDAPPIVREVPGPGKFSIKKARRPRAGPPRPRAPPAAAQEARGAAESADHGGRLRSSAGRPLLERRVQAGVVDHKVLAETGRRIAAKCAEFGVEGEVAEYHPGPVVTTYEFRPGEGIKVNQVMGLAEDLALALSAESIRVERLPGRASVGIEVPNPGGGEIISIRDVIESERFQQLAVPADAGARQGHPRRARRRRPARDAAPADRGHDRLRQERRHQRADHLDPVQGGAGSGQADPDRPEDGRARDVRGPAAPGHADHHGPQEGRQRPEVGGRADGGALPDALRRSVRSATPSSTTRRSRIPRSWREVRAQHPEDPDLKLEPMPLIVIIIDELADLMITAPKDVEESIVRIAQKARAVGIHLVVATQRPSVDVLTGVIKANLPSRIAFKVSSKIDSRVILDGNGAERLLGRGDMLFLPPGTSRLKRVHGAFVSVQETAALMKFLKKQAKPQFDEEITKDRVETLDRDDRRRRERSALRRGRAPGRPREDGLDLLPAAAHGRRLLAGR